MLFDFKILKIQDGWQSGSLQGYINEDYATLVEVFGEPHFSEPSGDGKVNTEWTLQFTVRENDADEGDEEYVFATIYDWKEPNAQVARTTPNYRWHIGGPNNDAVDVVKQAIQDHFKGN